MRQEASKSGYGWLGLAVFAVCVQSYKTGLWPFRLSNMPPEAGKPWRLVGLEAGWGGGAMCCNSDGATGHSGQQPGHR